MGVKLRFCYPARLVVQPGHFFLIHFSFIFYSLPPPLVSGKNEAESQFRHIEAERALNVVILLILDTHK